ncbi:hypothetical protein AHAS_Ahas15G0186100 [Arachis hypogaea]
MQQLEPKKILIEEKPILHVAIVNKLWIKQKSLCYVFIYCEKLIRGRGINRVKYYLVGKGRDIEACRKVPAVVRHQFNQNIEDLQIKKRKTQEEYAESYNACDEVEREVDEILLGIRHHSPLRKHF